MYICVYSCTFVLCMCVHNCFVHVCISVSESVCTFICVHVHVHVSVSACLYLRSVVCICMCLCVPWEKNDPLDLVEFPSSHTPACRAGLSAVLAASGHTCSSILSTWPSWRQQIDGKFAASGCFPGAILGWKTCQNWAHEVFSAQGFSVRCLLRCWAAPMPLVMEWVLFSFLFSVTSLLIIFDPLLFLSASFQREVNWGHKIYLFVPELSRF